MTIKKVLMERDSMTSDDADELIKEAKEALQEYLDDGDIEAAQEICMEYFDLEPDYIFELLN